MNENTAASAKPRGRWITGLLVASLAINIGIGGMFAGAALHAPSARGPGQAPDSIAIIARAMPQKYQRQLRASLRASRVELKPDRAALLTLRDRLVEALRGQPFDAQAVEAVFAQQRAILDSIIATGHQHVLQEIENMTPSDRKIFIRRLLGHAKGNAPATVNRP